MSTLTHWWLLFIQMVQAAHPAWLFFGMVFLPLSGLPASPLWISAGIRLGTLGGAALCAASLLLNLSLGYWLARAWLREPLTRLLARRHHRLPSLGGAGETELILLLRITPGVPLCVQNYVLGLAKVAFGPYLLISWPIQFGYALAFVWFGNSLAGSNAWRILSAVAAVLAVALATRVLRRGIRSRSAPAPIPADGPR
jgi:uncharacterized membrane protein YdjX (TVP38/TMEM64 family)